MKRAIALMMALLFGISSIAAGQDAAPHSGFWLSGGLGAATTDSGGDEDTGPAGYIRMGGTTSERVLLGGEVIGMSREAGVATISQGNATFSAFYYPASPVGFFAKAGVGFASATVASAVVSDDLGPGTFTTDESGFGLTFGAGYDIRIGGNLYLTPNLDVLVQSFDEFADSNLFLLTLGIGFH